MSNKHSSSSQEKFVVLFIPEVRNGISLSELKSNIKRLFNMSNDQVGALFMGRPTVIKTGADEDTALMYKRAIEECGGACWMEPEQADDQSDLMTA